ncbi:hypothetical protein N7453_005616 [Penicillium expansum]|nr:hypothetical protein N7453_005616 [Penicillium expansum]
MDFRKSSPPRPVVDGAVPVVADALYDRAEPSSPYEEDVFGNSMSTCHSTLPVPPCPSLSLPYGRLMKVGFASPLDGRVGRAMAPD